METIKEILDSRIKSSRTELRDRCCNLSKRLARIARKLDAHTPNHRLNINSLGEIQSEGLMIDIECARFGMMCEMEQLISGEKQ